MKYSRASGLAALVASLMALANCSERDLSHIDGSLLAAADAGSTDILRCVPGQTFACMGACGMPLVGYQVCAADGRSYGECICPPASMGPLGVDLGSGKGPTFLPPLAGGLGTPAGRPAAAPRRDSVGAECRTDADCASGLECLAATGDALGGGGPAGGYCTVACQSANDCAAVDPASACATLGGQSLCTRVCQSGDPAPGENKCLGRADLTCTSVAALGQEQPSGERQIGICVPGCQSDAACDGRRCDLGRGLCTDAPAAGDAIGSACEGAGSCGGGICLGLSPQLERFCSAFCTLGVDGCGFDGSEPVIDAACVLAQIEGEGLGDRGLCVELCDTAADCELEGSTCVPEPTRGRAGVCLRPLDTPAPPDLPEPPAFDAGTPPSADAGSPIDTTIGAACAADIDCGTGELCLRPDDDPFGAGGGPAGGYCSAPCQRDADCPGGAICAATTAGGFCVQSCIPGAAAQCDDRETLDCEILSGGVNPRGFCRPDCNTDADCEGRVCSPNGLCLPAPCSADADCPGQICDLELGTCVDPPVCSLDADCAAGICNVAENACVPAPDIPIGGACSDDAECAGEICAELGPSNLCSGICLLGSDIGCEPYGTEAFCLLPLDDTGDLGLCLALCDTADDCPQPGFDCLATGVTINGHSGGCLPPGAAE